METDIKLKNEEIRRLLDAKSLDFPKYSTQILNLANQNAQGTRPKVVGQMSELIQEFSGKSIKEWEEWYLKKHPDAIKTASDKIFEMVANFRNVMDEIDRHLIENWVYDLVIVKTFIGLRFQEAILRKIGGLLKKGHRLATPEDESRGIDGFIGEVPVSIKPESYRSKGGLNENIEVKIVYYKKVKDGVNIDMKALVPE